MRLAELDVGECIDLRVFDLAVVIGEAVADGEIFFREGGDEASPEHEESDGVGLMDGTKFIETLTKGEKNGLLQFMVVGEGMEAAEF